MKGRYCVKSSDGFWLLYNRYTGATQYCLDPAPPEPATSFLGKTEAAIAMAQCDLPSLPSVLKAKGFATYQAMREAGDCTVVWAIVPDPNP
jgi:hypothetical protein